MTPPTSLILVALQQADIYTTLRARVVGQLGGYASRAERREHGKALVPSPRGVFGYVLAGITVAALAYPFVVPALLLTLATAIGKEILDAKGNGTPEIMGAVATLLGGAVLVVWYQLWSPPACSLSVAF